MQPDKTEVSHLEIYKLLIEVKTTLDITLKRNEEDRERDKLEKADIFSRIGTLETRMAQVIIIAVAISIAIPVAVEAMNGRLLQFMVEPAPVIQPRDLPN